MRIDPIEVAQKYNSIDVIWDPSDKWHWRTHQMIKKFTWSTLEELTSVKPVKILNAGSAGYGYGISEEILTHVDIAAERISHLPNSIVASVENLPFKDQSFDLVLCVGSVLNYCDPIATIQEISRTTKEGGYAILEYENSNTLELVGKSIFNKPATLVKTFYKGEDETIWYYSDDYINEIAADCGLKRIRTQKCHILSPLVYRFTRREKFAAKFAKLDRLLSKVPWIKHTSSNTISLFIKEDASHKDLS